MCLCVSVCLCAAGRVSVGLRCSVRCRRPAGTVPGSGSGAEPPARPALWPPSLPRAARWQQRSGNFVRCLCAQGAAAVAAPLPAPTRRLPLPLFGFEVNIYLQRSGINHSCRGKLISGDLFP